MAKPLVIHWEGNIDLGNVELQSSQSEMVPQIPQNIIMKEWTKFYNDHPHAYDGHIVRLLDFEDLDGRFLLQIGEMRFSEINAMFHLKIPRREKYGQLGIAMIIFDRDKERILLGRRSKATNYRPLFYCLPGGILEEQDTNLQQACLRELKEEILEEIDYEKFTLLALIDNYDSLGVQAIIGVTTSYKISSKTIDANEEWDEEQISWIKLSELSKFNNEDCLTDLQYASQKISKLPK